MERIRIRNNLFDTLSSGLSIGADTLRDKRPSRYTYRASSLVITVTVLGRIIDDVAERNFQANDFINSKDISVINIIRSGLVERTVDGKMLDVLKPQDFFGEEGAILRTPSQYVLRALTNTSVLQIPGELLRDVPIITMENFGRLSTSESSNYTGYLLVKS